MSARVAISDDGQVLVRTGKVELGQGLHLALAQIVADELEVPLSQVRMLPVDTESSPDEGVTSGSLSVQDAGAALRKACAELRPELRSGGAHRSIVGQSPPRPDLAEVFAGHAHFIHDLELDGMLHGRVLHPPRLGATVADWDEGAARSAEGLLHLQRDGQLFGLIAATGAQADAALQRLAGSVRWQFEGGAVDESADVLPSLPAVTRIVSEKGEPPSGPGQGLRMLSARYTKPWILHASMGPSCALACWDGDGHLQVWSHSQGIFNLRRDLAMALGLQSGAVRVTHVPGAGCYGHNGADDVAFDAAWLARAVHGHPVRVTWTRADEMALSPAGPAMAVEMRALVDVQGHVRHWQHALWSPGHSRRPGRSDTPALLGSWQLQSPHVAPPSIDVSAAMGGGAERNAVPGYELPAWRIVCHGVQTARRSSALRSLGAFANVFAAECFVDEVALATGIDPLAWRRRHLRHDPRALAVLDAAAARAGWGTFTASEGRGLGLAVARYKNTGAWCAVVAEVHAAERLRVHRLTIAVDVGLAVHPDGVANQIEGGAIQATSWTLLESARPDHADRDDYPILRFSEVPAVDVVVMPSSEPSLGAGEASLGPTAAAIGNALFNAMGLRVRDLPLTPERIVAAMANVPA
jgi:CO/xanthine dehydrogenase Mo-binding subunit